MIVAAAVVLAAGVAIPKLTVRDLAPVDDRVKRCVTSAINSHYDNPFERAALYLGQSRIVSATPTSAEIESFTLFRIPLGVLRGIPDLKVGILCNLIGEWNTDPVTSASLLSLPGDLPSGWYAHRSSDTSFLITKQHDLPDIGGTESYAYGDQVGISLLTTTLSPRAWAASQQWLGDEALIRKTTWTVIHGHALLQIEHETQARPQLTDYLFAGKYVYVISLYPSSSESGLNLFNAFLEGYDKQATVEAKVE